VQAVRYDAYGQTPVLVEMPEPVCPPDGVVVAVGATGVCRSDWHAWQGHDPVSLPHVPGHELAGTVLRVGEQVRGWRPGARVTAPFVCGCGTCETCRAGDEQVCPHQTQPGFTHPGSFAEQVVIHAADVNLVALPDDMGFVAAASLGCRFATAYRALTAHGRLAAGEWLAVHGCGGVGLSAVMLGAALGARVVAVDPAGPSRRLAQELGAEVVLDVAQDVPEVVRGVTGGGAHVSIDAVGSSATAVASVLGLRRRGRHVQVGLLFGPDATPPLPMDRVVAHELEIYGSHGLAARDYPPLLDLVARAPVRPERLVGRVVGLAQAGEALAGLGAPGSTPGLTVVDVTGR
jgi:alcohol dehydrogenase